MNMTITELKQYIFDNDKVGYILEQLGCSHISFNSNKEYYSACFPDGDNPKGVVISNNQYLRFISYSRNVKYDDNQDLISLVEYIKHVKFFDAVKKLHDILGLPFKLKRESKPEPKKVDHLDIFKRHLCGCRQRIDVDEIHAIDEEMLNDYVPMLHISWFKEGIMPWTQKKFGLAYSYKRKRIIIPLRYWQDGSLMGTNARTTVENASELGVKKYFITPSYQKSVNLYGLYENYKAIQDAGYCVIYEAEKSVLKRDSRNDPTGVAIQGHSLSDEQARILIGLNVDIIIAMDNDVPIEEIRFMAEKFQNIRNVFYIKDKWNLMGAKDSPADMTNKVFNFLMRFKVKYDLSEHNEYLKSLGKKG